MLQTAASARQTRTILIGAALMLALSMGMRQTGATHEISLA